MRDIEVVDLIKVVWRWLWLIIIAVVITVGILYFQTDTVPVYSAEVVLFVSTPDREDVAATDEYTFTNDRDLIATAINSFVEIAQYQDVKERTQNELSIAEDYQISVDAELGADFIYVSTLHESPELAQQIADAHAENAIEYYGELRALPSSQALQFFNQELADAQQELIDAQNALTSFHTTHNIIALDRELAIQEAVLEGLELSYSELLLQNSNPLNPQVVPQSDIDDVQQLIEARRTRIAELNHLKPEFEMLQAALTEARENLNSVTNQVDVTELREAFSSQAMFIQIIKPAALPDSPVNRRTRILILGGLASLGFGILLAFFLDYLRYRW